MYKTVFVSRPTISIEYNNDSDDSVPFWLEKLESVQ